MIALGEPVQTEPVLLLIAGLIMVLTLWFSTKARAVVKTSVDLARQDEGKERFEPNFLSRNIVRLSIGVSEYLNNLLPERYNTWTDKQFVQPVVIKSQDAPAFDLVRAAVNLMVASVLISIATSMKLPLSTTYVTFMVTMGTSLADRAWGTESAVYRVAGVLNVIGRVVLYGLECLYCSLCNGVYLVLWGGLCFGGPIYFRFSHDHKKLSIASKKHKRTY
jgi:hypothetical protein